MRDCKTSTSSSVFLYLSGSNQRGVFLEKLSPRRGVTPPPTHSDSRVERQQPTERELEGEKKRHLLKFFFSNIRRQPQSFEFTLRQSFVVGKSRWCAVSRLFGHTWLLAALHTHGHTCPFHQPFPFGSQVKDSRHQLECIRAKTKFSAGIRHQTWQPPSDFLTMSETRQHSCETVTWFTVTLSPSAGWISLTPIHVDATSRDD